MKTFKSIGAILSFTITPLCFFSCSSGDTIIVNEQPISINENMVKGINVTLQDFEATDAKTRTAYSAGDSGIKVTWATGDTIGIFPNEGGQVEFPIQTGAESNEATFDGGGWALRAANTYAAYYPYSKWNVFRDNKTILLDYTGQTQTTNGSTEHLGKYDYQATGGVQTNSSGYLNFQFQHLGALMVFNLTIPKAGTYTSLTLTSSEEVFVTKAELDISGSEPVVNSTDASNTFTLSLDNVQLENDNFELVAYMMLAPVDLSNGSLGLSLKGTHDYTCTLTGHLLEAGSKYNINPSLQESEQNEEKPEDGIISFADPRVKDICVLHFDSDGDGELSMSEAAAVTSIPCFFATDIPVFAFGNYDSKPIYYFNEFQYFTSIKEIPDNMFKDQENLAEITLPQTLTSIGNRSFSGCANLKVIQLPNSVTTIGKYAFSGCDLKSIDFPSSMTVIGDYAFCNCGPLREITIPEYVTYIGNSSFNNCWLTRIEIPNSVTSIGNYAFCSKAWCTHIYCYASNPPLLGTGAFGDVGVPASGSQGNADEESGAWIHVPSLYINDYKDKWKEYARSIILIPE